MNVGVKNFMHPPSYNHFFGLVILYLHKLRLIQKLPLEAN